MYMYVRCTDVFKSQILWPITSSLPLPNWPMTCRSINCEPMYYVTVIHQIADMYTTMDQTTHRTDSMGEPLMKDTPQLHAWTSYPRLTQAVHVCELTSSYMYMSPCYYPLIRSHPNPTLHLISIRFVLPYYGVNLAELEGEIIKHPLNQRILLCTALYMYVCMQLLAIHAGKWPYIHTLYRAPCTFMDTNSTQPCPQATPNY